MDLSIFLTLSKYFTSLEFVVTFDLISSSTGVLDSQEEEKVGENCPFPPFL